MVVGVGDPAVVFLLELVEHGAGVGVPAAPELLDEVLFLLGTGQLLEDRPFIMGDDVDDRVVQPLVVVVDGLFAGGVLFLGTRPGYFRSQGQEKDQKGR